MTRRVQGGSRAKLVMSVFVVMAVVASMGLWAVLGVGNTSAQVAEAATGISTKAGDTSWRNTMDTTTPDGADRRPELYQLLANNNKVETGNDELRMDFVVRVAHGEVDPTVGTGFNPGMRIIYDYGDGSGSGDSYAPDYTHPVNYLKTTGSSNGGVRWAQNQDEYYTIEKIVESGLYDYVTVSVQGDMNIPDEGATWWNLADKNGRTVQRHVFVAVGPYANPGSYGLGGVTTAGMDAWPLAVDIANGRTITAFPYRCLSDDKKYTHGCAAPNAFVGWDSYPKLWSQHQSNWGLDLDNAIGGTDVYKLNANADGLAGTYPASTTFPEGTAPPDSFFVEWFDPASSGAGETNPCFTHTSFKFQWFGLQNGTDWVPVTDLTPTAQQVDNQSKSWDGTPPTGSVDMTKLSALNASTAADHNLMAKDSSQTDGLAPAQNADGSIDFAKAKRDQVNPQAKGTPGEKDYRGLDGYFKLVTWPVMPAGCDVSSLTADSDLSQLIPSPTNPANPTDVSSKVGDSQADIQRRIDVGWTLDTAFYKFDVARPDTPVITGVSNGIDENATEAAPKALKSIAKTDANNFALGDTKVSVKAKTDSDDHIAKSAPTIHGTGTAGDTVTLYSDEPSDPDNMTISKSHNQETDTEGTKVGTATVKPDGTWEIADTSTLSTDLPVTRRYHAYQADMSSAYQIASYFSGIGVVHFSDAGNPSITDVTSTPVVNGAMADGSEVVVSGQATSNSVDSTLSMSVSTHGSTAAADTNPYAPSCSVSTIPSGQTMEYTCTYADSGENKGATWFKDHSMPNKAKFDFTADLSDALGNDGKTTVNETVDFWAPKAGLTSVDATGAHGTMASTLADDASLDVAGGTVTLMWKSGSDEVTSDPVDVHKDGAWTVDAPRGMTSGTVTAVATNYADGTSAEESMPFQLGVPISQLPFTGGQSLWKLGIALVAAVVLGAVALALVARRSRGVGLHAARGRHRG